MSDPQIPAWNELGERVQAMAGRAPETRPRSQWEQYEGAPLPIGPLSGARPIPSPIPSYEAFEDLRVVGSPSSARVAASGAAKDSNHAPDSPRIPIQNHAQPQAQLPPANNAPDDPNAPKSGMQRLVQSFRTALPYVQKLLPLLEGNIATTVSALMAPQMMQHPAPPAPPPVRIDLEPIERALAEVRASQLELRGQVQEQSVALKRVEDQLERVREATDRNTLEQQELVEDIRSVGNRISNLTVIGLVLLAMLLGVNVYFLVQLQHILR